MANPEWTEPWEWEDCAKCGATPVRELIDDDPLCQDCCDEWARNERIQAAIDAFNADPPSDNFHGHIVKHKARWPILATDCDYEIVSVSGVQGKRI